MSPCPIGKELIPIHPRKVYYFLTTLSRQDFPADSSDILSSSSNNNIGSGGKGGRRIISPSLSGASLDDDIEGSEDHKREVMSPSPEVDLSIPELDATAPGAEDDFATPLTPAGSSFSGRSSLARDGTSGAASEGLGLVHNHRAASPPLEGDEKEFTQTASNMRMRGMSLDDTNIRQSTEIGSHAVQDSVDMQMEETEEEKAKRNREVAAALFGSHHEHTPVGSSVLSSPMVKALHANSLAGVKKEDTEDVEMRETVSILGENVFGSNWDIKEPENVELDELDDLLGGF